MKIFSKLFAKSPTHFSWIVASMLAVTNSQAFGELTITKGGIDSVFEVTAGLSNPILATDDKLPTSFDSVVDLKFAKVELNELLNTLGKATDTDIVISRELDDVVFHDISYLNTSANAIFSEILSREDLTYKFVGEDLLFVYRDNAYQACLYNNENTQALKIKKNNTLGGNALSIDVEDMSLNNILQTISSFADQNVFIDSKLLTAYGKNTFANTTDSLHLSHKTIDQILTVLTYRNGLSYRFLNHNIISIVPSTKSKACQKLSELQTIDLLKQ